MSVCTAITYKRTNTPASPIARYVVHSICPCHILDAPKHTKTKSLFVLMCDARRRRPHVLIQQSNNIGRTIQRNCSLLWWNTNEYTTTPNPSHNKPTPTIKRRERTGKLSSRRRLCMRFRFKGCCMGQALCLKVDRLICVCVWIEGLFPSSSDWKERMRSKWVRGSPASAADQNHD